MPYVYQRGLRAPLQRKSLALEAQRLPRQARIFGLPADSFIRVAAPVFTGVISAVGLIYSLRGRHEAATGLALTGVLVSSFVAMGQQVQVEESRLREAP